MRLRSIGNPWRVAYSTTLCAAPASVMAGLEIGVLAMLPTRVHLRTIGAPVPQSGVDRRRKPRYSHELRLEECQEVVDVIVTPLVAPHVVLGGIVLVKILDRGNLFRFLGEIRFRNS
jgi:hypothetical protein